MLTSWIISKIFNVPSLYVLILLCQTWLKFPTYNHIVLAFLGAGRELFSESVSEPRLFREIIWDEKFPHKLITIYIIHLYVVDSSEKGVKIIIMSVVSSSCQVSCSATHPSTPRAATLWHRVGYLLSSRGITLICAVHFLCLKHPAQNIYISTNYIHYCVNNQYKQRYFPNCCPKKRF